jgi:HEAT repeat protein
MKGSHPSSLPIARLLTISLSWCLFTSSSHAQSGPLEDQPYVPSASVVKGTVAALSDSSEEVAALAVRALADWRQAAAADAIAKLLAVGTPETIRTEAFQFFSRLGPQAKPHIAAVLKNANDPDPNIRAAVLGVVFQAQASAENAEAIRPLLDDPRSDVRAAAARCLGQAGKAAAAHRQALVDALAKSGSPEFKAAALRALTQIGGLTGANIDVIAPLIRDREAEVRIAAWATTLSGLLDAKAAGGITDEKDKAVRAALVAQFQNEPPEVKSAIIEDIGKDKDSVKASIAALVNQIRTGTIEVKAASLRVLGKAGEAALEQVPLITEQAKDPDSTVRAAAISALGSLGSAAVRPNVSIIASGLLDPSDLVRDEALLALPVAGDAMRNFPYKVRDVYPTASPAVRATLVKALPIGAQILGMDDDALARIRATLADPNEDIRIGAAFVMGQLGAKLGGAALPDLLALLKAPEASVRGAATVALRAFVTDAAAKQKLRDALRPLLKDRDAEVRWAALDTLHELDPAQDPALVAEIAALLKDEEQPVRAAAVRTLGAAGAAAKPHLLDIIRFFNDDPAVPPYAAAEAVQQISPLTPQELTSLLYPLYVFAELQPIVRLTAYGASGGDPDGLLIIRLLGRSRSATKDVVTKADEARATALLQDALKAALLDDKLKAEITSRLAEVKGTR